MSTSVGDPAPSRTSRPARLRLAGVALVVAVTAYLVHAEVVRPELPPGVRLIGDRVYRDAGGHRLKLDLYAPTGAIPSRGFPAVVAIHGGGWRGGSKGEYGRSLAELAQNGRVIAAIDYRLSRPGAPSWPGNLDDVRAAVRWLRTHASEFGVDPDRIALLGASAGGHLALLAGLSETGDPRDRVDAVIDFYGPTDLMRLAADSPPAAGSVSLLLGEAVTDPVVTLAASPVFQVRASAPPVLLIHGADDALVPFDQSQRLAVALETAGVRHRLIIVPDARHGFGLRAGETDLLPEIAAFLGSVWPDHHVQQAR